jgi:hypothetical protein
MKAPTEAGPRDVAAMANAGLELSRQIIRLAESNPSYTASATASANILKQAELIEAMWEQMKDA